MSDDSAEIIKYYDGSNTSEFWRVRDVFAERSIKVIIDRESEKLKNEILWEIKNCCPPDRVYFINDKLFYRNEVES